MIQFRRERVADRPDHWKRHPWEPRRSEKLRNAVPFFAIFYFAYLYQPARIFAFVFPRQRGAADAPGDPGF